jgi:hypothetical protein
MQLPLYLSVTFYFLRLTSNRNKVLPQLTHDG